ncbi:MAG TPA: FAD-binding protein, partial [Myxococcaceae bacterium]
MSAPSLVTPAPAPPPVLPPPGVVERLIAIVGDRNVIREPVDLRTYECDALTSFRAAPSVVVLPASTEEVAKVVRVAVDAGMPIVPRGAGTGLSGGALPVAGCVLVGLSRMKRILEVDLDNGFIRVQPGVINLDVSKEISTAGYYYAPDPSSQSVCTIGGNVAENSGGAHCLKYGFTVNHVRGVRMVTASGDVVDIGGPVLDPPGYDLLGVVVGSEGTLGIVTEVVLRILRKPEATRTLFATFPSTTEGGNCVSEIIGKGIVPAAIEMMDRLAIQAAVAATGVDWPDVGAALLMDVDGCTAEAEHTAEVAVSIARRTGALEVRVPKNEDERMLMWKGRKSAFAAMGRLAPNYIVQDGVIPRNDIARVLAEIARLSEERGLRVANVFHAGDGNLHPLVLYDARVPGQERAAEELAGEIL